MAPDGEQDSGHARPHATGGVYVNFLTADEQDRVRAAYGANYPRLAALKAKHDPDKPLPRQFQHPPGGLASELD